MKSKLHFDKNIISAVLLILLLSTFFLIASVMIDHIATESCYQVLEDAASQLSANIKDHVSGDREQLEVIASILAGCEDIRSQEAQKLLCSYEQRGMITTIGLLLPDNSLQLCSGEIYEETDLFDYHTELDRIPYLSGMIPCPSGSVNQYLYHAVPVQKGNKITGILYGFINPDAFTVLYPVTAFNGSAELYIIDGTTGAFIADTLHDSLGNISSTYTAESRTKPGYSFEKVKNDLLTGNSGSIACWSRTKGEYLYAYYKPAGINQWMVMLTVQESIVFANAVRIRHVFCLLAAVNIILLLSYFMWVLLQVRRKTSEQEQQLTQTLYMLDIQQDLFNVHKNPAFIRNALEKCAHKLTAQNAFLLTLDNTREKELFTWPDKDIPFTPADICDTLPYTASRLLSRESILLYDMGQLNIQSPADYHTLRRYDIENIILTPVLDSGNNLAGLLGVSNCKQKWKDAGLLECVALNFFMAVNNLNSYKKIHEMGTLDMLTGLLNRNSYQNNLSKYLTADSPCLCCIYLDANGLHELNNHLGHAAGDSMLHMIGTLLKETFGEEDSYRIGGDEFVAFCRSHTEKEVLVKIAALEEKLRRHNYHVSIGISWKDDSRPLDSLIAQAEKKMYEAKRLYYEDRGDACKSREMNRKLEQILLEKQDFETFLSIISTYFMGVYVVNLRTDNTRTIYKPFYFDTILEETDYHFLEAINKYADTFVYPDDRPAFYAFLDYAQIESALDSGKTPHLHYRKADGTRLVLRIYPAAGFNGRDSYDRNSDHRNINDTDKETFWLFEKEK